MKNIIFLADGTRNNHKDKTNIWITSENLKQNAQQIKLYDQGVGTKLGNTVRGVIWGRGINKNIMDGFKFISDNYEAGDRIYLFGFSRGAYTVRSLASMISLCGLAPKNANPYSHEAFFDVYKQNRKPDFKQRAESLASIYDGRKATIEALCVWDTVGSVGRQTRTTDIRKKLSHPYHRMTIYPAIKRVYHAVSLDERRTQYWPHLMIGQVKDTSQSSMEEVWFAGVHADIGGGYDDRKLRDIPSDRGGYDNNKLSNISLHWMLSKVSGKNDLDIKAGFLDSLILEPCCKMHNSEKGPIFSFFQKRSRAIARGSKLHRSILLRIAGPLQYAHQHREPSGNYTPLALNFANYAMPPTFRLENYTIVD